MRLRFLQHYGSMAPGREWDCPWDATARVLIRNGVAVLADGQSSAPDETTGYDSWTLDELHKEATEREIEGHGTMSKAALVKALEKNDKARAKSKSHDKK